MLNWWCVVSLLAGLQAPVRLPVAGKLVYSPHVYGPDVFCQPYFNDANFPHNMPDIWTRHFGWVTWVLVDSHSRKLSHALML